MNWMQRLKQVEPLPPQEEPKNFDADFLQAIGELNQMWADAGWTMAHIPIEQRRRADQLEREMTQAADEGRLVDARAALSKWKECYIPQGEEPGVSVWCSKRKPVRHVSIDVCRWHKREDDPVCEGCDPENSRGASIENHGFK